MRRALNYMYFGMITVVVYFFLETRLFWLDFTHVRWWALFTHSYVHSSWQHLIFNLLSYLVLVGVSYYNYRQAKRTAKYNIAFLNIVIFTPLITSLLNIAIFSMLLGITLPPMTGFSSIIAALLGLTFFSVANIWKIKELYFLYLVPMVIVVLLRPWFLFSAALIFLPMYFFLLKKPVELKKAPMLLFSLAVLSVFSAALFPRNLLDHGNVVNIVSHLIGLAYGLILGFASA